MVAGSSCLAHVEYQVFSLNCSHQTEVPRRGSKAIAQLRYVVLSIASAFLVLQLSEQVAAAALGKAALNTSPDFPSACYGWDPTHLPEDFIYAAGGDNPIANIWSDGENCGQFFMIQCRGKGCKSHGPIKVKIVGRCPDGCSGGRAFELSYVAFTTIAHLDAGVIEVEYSRAS